jgi:hypothetical protein
MAMIKLSRSFGANRLAARMAKSYGALTSGIGRLFGDTTGDIVLNAGGDARAKARAAQLFAQALHEDSNHEMDWLWYAANMISDAQQRYCLERALRINPDSDLAKRALARLARASR